MDNLNSSCSLGFIFFANASCVWFLDIKNHAASPMYNWTRVGQSPIGLCKIKNAPSAKRTLRMNLHWFKLFRCMHHLNSSIKSVLIFKKGKSEEIGQFVEFRMKKKLPPQSLILCVRFSSTRFVPGGLGGCFIMINPQSFPSCCPKVCKVLIEFRHDQEMPRA